MILNGKAFKEALRIINEGLKKQSQQKRTDQPQGDSKGCPEPARRQPQKSKKQICEGGGKIK